MRRSLALVALLISLALSGGASAAPSGRAPGPGSSITLPFTLDHNRMIVAVDFVRRDGSLRRAAAWVDTGNEALVLAEPLARDLGLDLPALADGAKRAATLDSAPGIRLGGLALDVRGIRTQVPRGPIMRPGVPAEAQIPASALRHHVVVFDYPARRLTVAPPGALAPRGAEVPCRVNAVTGLPMVSVVIEGDTIALGIDNGSAGTWVSDSLTRRWGARHAERSVVHGAAGCANFFGFPFETTGVLTRVPEVRIGSTLPRDVAVLGLDQALFDWYSRKSAGPVLGFLGANVLRGYRLTIDFPGQRTWWEAGPRPDPHDLDLVGLTIRADAGGGYTVAGVVTSGGAPLVEGIRAGDRLVAVDGVDTAHRSFGSVVDALRGAPGSTRALTIEREGTRATVRARVTRLP